MADNVGSEHRWVMTIPVISTAHIKQDTLSKLNPHDMADYEEGAFVNVVATDETFPDELLPVIEWFKRAYPEEHWIRFDCDGDIIEGLPTYDW